MANSRSREAERTGDSRHSDARIETGRTVTVAPGRTVHVTATLAVVGLGDYGPRASGKSDRQQTATSLQDGH